VEEKLLIQDAEMSQSKSSIKTLNKLITYNEGIPLLILCKETFGVKMTANKVVIKRNKTLSRLGRTKIHA
jgi:hypothetical protein